MTRKQASYVSPQVDIVVARRVLTAFVVPAFALIVMAMGEWSGLSWESRARWLAAAAGVGLVVGVVVEPFRGRLRPSILTAITALVLVGAVRTLLSESTAFWIGLATFALFVSSVVPLFKPRAGKDRGL